MVTQELLGYMDNQLRVGKTRQEIEKALLSSGWPQKDINEAFIRLQPANVPKVALTVENPPTTFLEPSDLLRSTWQIYRKRFWTFLGVELISTIIIAIVILVLIGSMTAFFGLNSSFSSNLPFPLLITLAVFLFIFVSVLSAWGQTALFYAIVKSKENIGIKEAYRLGWRKIASYIWLSFLSGIIIFAGFVLFIIPGIIFTLWFSLAFYVMVTEDMKGLNALLKSKEYVKGRLLGVLWRFVLLLILVFPLIIPILLVSLLNIKILSEILDAIFTLIISPFVLVYGFLVYKNLRFLKGNISFEPTGRSKLFLILITFLGLLFAIVPILLVGFLSIMNPFSQMRNARDAQRKNNRLELRNALDRYYVEKNTYPGKLDELVPDHMRIIPVDPQSKLPYMYNLEESGKNYKLCIQMEEGNLKCENRGS